MTNFAGMGGKAFTEVNQQDIVDQWMVSTKTKVNKDVRKEVGRCGGVGGVNDVHARCSRGGKFGSAGASATRRSPSAFELLRSK